MSENNNSKWLWIAGILGAGFFLFSSFKTDSGNNDTTNAPVVTEKDPYHNFQPYTPTFNDTTGKWEYTNSMGLRMQYDLPSKTWKPVAANNNPATVVDEILSTNTVKDVFGIYAQGYGYYAEVISPTMSYKANVDGSISDNALLKTGTKVMVYGQWSKGYYTTDQGIVKETYVEESK